MIGALPLGRIIRTRDLREVPPPLDDDREQGRNAGWACLRQIPDRAAAAV
ncbi:hypothetical protein [Rhodococcus gordoniae]